MELLPPAIFASSVASSKESLKRISNIISRYRGNDAAQKFQNACDTLDFDTANRILDETVKELTGIDSVSLALSDFADKFPNLNPKLSDDVYSASSEAEKVKAIDRYFESISDTID